MESEWGWGDWGVSGREVVRAAPAHSHGAPHYRGGLDVRDIRAGREEKVFFYCR